MTINQSFLKDLVTNAISDTKNESQKQILAIFPNHFDIRHYVQSARFTIHGHKKALEYIDGASNFLAKIEISPKAKREIIDILKFLRITEDYLYPDLEHLAKHLATFP